MPSPLNMAAHRRQVLRLIDLHGRNAMAFQALETGYQYFFDGDHGCMPYVEEILVTGFECLKCHGVAPVQINQA